MCRKHSIFSLGNANDWGKLLRNTFDQVELRFYLHVLETLDSKLFLDLWEKHGSDHQKNWLNLPRYLKIAYSRIRKLNLHSCEAVDALDLACGPGYVSYVARYFGHRAIGLDRPGNELFSDVDRLLGAERIAQNILPKAPLGIDRRFDLITAFNASFHLRKSGDWTLEEWAFFLDDLRQNLLNSGGRVHLVMNGGPWKRDRFFEFIKQQGYLVDNKAIVFS